MNKYATFTITVIGILGLIFFLISQNVDTTQQAQAQTKAQASLKKEAQTNTAKQAPHILQKKTSSGFVYKSDTRPFEQRPQNDAAIRQKWTDKHDQMVLVTPKPRTMNAFYIDAFEATVSGNRAWSVPGHIPTDRLRFHNAKAMCEAAGKRICKTKEWQAACRGGITQPIKFGQPQKLLQSCDFARGKPYTEMDFINKTDSHPSCINSTLPLYHMIGNVAEFTQNDQGQTEVVGLTYYDVHIQNKAQAVQLACEQINHPNGRYPAQQYNKGTGFRCCKDIR